MVIKTYQEFIDTVERLGVVSFYGKFVEGFPRVQDMAGDWQWHTDEDYDPWAWKIRAVDEQRLAFGCLLGGTKGFIAKAMYPLFYAANRPTRTLEQRYRDGLISQTAYRVYRLFEDGRPWTTADIRTALGVSKKSGASAVDGAIVQLQREYLISLCGNSYRADAKGQTFGWAINTYCLTEEWADDWLPDTLPDRDEARHLILAHCAAWNRGIDERKLAKALFRDE